MSARLIGVLLSKWSARSWRRFEDTGIAFDLADSGTSQPDVKPL